MRWSQTFIPTMKEVPSDAEIPSHQLMLRAGLIRQLMAGAYTYLPLGYRALRKAEAIVREEMDAAGGIELFMPALQPIDLFERTGRKDAFGNVLINFHVRRGDKTVHLALGPTHEEVVTDLVSRHISSYRQLPLTLYQIQTKFRNEERPRFGVLADERIPDERRLQLPHVRRVAQRHLSEDVPRLLPHLCSVRPRRTCPWRPRAGPSAAMPRTSS